MLRCSQSEPCECEVYEKLSALSKVVSHLRSVVMITNLQAPILNAVLTASSMGSLRIISEFSLATFSLYPSPTY